MIAFNKDKPPPKHHLLEDAVSGIVGALAVLALLAFMALLAGMFVWAAKEVWEEVFQ